jgi:small subunit ribosomal protein S7
MRKTASGKRPPTQPDPKYGDTMLTTFVNNIMKDGKKTVAFRVVYDALEIVERKTGENGLEVWKTALSNIMPSVQVKSRRVGGSTFQIPAEVRPQRKMALGMRWMIMFARKRNGKGMADKLAAEIIAASNNEGGAVKRKEDTHRMAEANKAFSHFRF